MVVYFDTYYYFLISSGSLVVPKIKTTADHWIENWTKRVPSPLTKDFRQLKKTNF